jgi:hypothetical protein
MWNRHNKPGQVNAWSSPAAVARADAVRQLAAGILAGLPVESPEVTRARREQLVDDTPDIAWQLVDGVWRADLPQAS